MTRFRTDCVRNLPPAGSVAGAGTRPGPEARLESQASECDGDHGRFRAGAAQDRGADPAGWAQGPAGFPRRARRGRARHPGRGGFGRGARPFPRGVRGGGAPITEGAAVPATSLREGLYRRTLAAADGLAAAAIILVVLPLMSDGTPAAMVFFLVPLVVLVHKAVGLYERDELVLKKTTLDEAPALLRIGAMHTLL